MATAKKTTATKKTTARKPATAAKRVTAKKAVPTRKAAPRKTTASKKVSKKAAEYESFKLSSNQPPIKSFKITKQTVYWVIIMAFIIFFQLWIIKLQVEVAQLIQDNQTQIIEDL